MRREPDFFGDQELTLVYMARRLKHALAMEKVLDAAGLDYAVEPDTYQGGLLSRPSARELSFMSYPSRNPRHGSLSRITASNPTTRPAGNNPRKRRFRDQRYIRKGQPAGRPCAIFIGHDII